MTPQEVLQRTRFEINETSAAFWSDDEIYMYMSAAESLIATKVPCCQAVDGVNTVSGTRAYALPADFSKSHDLRVNLIKMQKINMYDLEVIEGNTESTGSPQYYYEWGNYYYLVPTPTEVMLSNLFYNNLPATVVSSSTTFTVPVVFTPYIPDYCLMRCFLKDDELGQKAAIHKAEWEKGLENIQKVWDARAGSDQEKFVKDIDLYRGTNVGVLRYLF